MVFLNFPSSIFYNYFNSNIDNCGHLNGFNFNAANNCTISGLTSISPASRNRNSNILSQILSANQNQDQTQSSQSQERHQDAETHAYHYGCQMHGLPEVPYPQSQPEAQIQKRSILKRINLKDQVQGFNNNSQQNLKKVKFLDDKSELLGLRSTNQQDELLEQQAAYQYQVNTEKLCQQVSKSDVDQMPEQLKHNLSATGILSSDDSEIIRKKLLSLLLHIETISKKILNLEDDLKSGVLQKLDSDMMSQSFDNESSTKVPNLSYNKQSYQTPPMKRSPSGSPSMNLKMPQFTNSPPMLVKKFQSSESNLPLDSCLHNKDIESQSNSSSSNSCTTDFDEPWNPLLMSQCFSNSNGNQKPRKTKAKPIKTQG